MEPGEVLDLVQRPGEAKGTGEVETLNDLLLVPDEAHVMILYKEKTSIEIHVCLRLDVVIVRCLHLHSVVDGAEAVATGVHDRAHAHQKDITISDFCQFYSFTVFQLLFRKHPVLCYKQYRKSTWYDESWLKKNQHMVKEWMMKRIRNIMIPVRLLSSELSRGSLFCHRFDDSSPE